MSRFAKAMFCLGLATILGAALVGHADDKKDDTAKKQAQHASEGKKESEHVFDGRKDTPPAVKESTSTHHQDAAAIAKRENNAEKVRQTETSKKEHLDKTNVPSPK